MILTEDKKLQEFVLSGQSCIAVPFEMFVPAKGEAVITVYDGFKAFAENYIKQFQKDLFSAEALKALDDKLSAFAESIGFEHFRDSEYIQYEYKMTNAENVKRELILKGTKEISSDREFLKYENFADRDVEISDDGGESCFVHIENGAIVALAGVNDIECDDGSCEINVITAEGYRGRGYGASCVSALALSLIEGGKRVSYKFRSDNESSRALCLKCGFELSGRRFSYVCYSKNDN